MSHQKQYDFTEDWFSRHAPIWSAILQPYQNTPCKALEIGSFQGRSAVWMLENILLHPESHITCIDPFCGSEEHTVDQTADMYARFKRNVIDNFPTKVACYKDFSSNVLKLAEIRDNRYDVVYIDGDHHAYAALEDAILAFPLLKVGGVLIFDDYLGGGERMNTPNEPYLGIHSFITTFAPKIRIIYAGYQLYLQKVAE